MSHSVTALDPSLPCQLYYTAGMSTCTGLQILLSHPPSDTLECEQLWFRENKVSDVFTFSFCHLVFLLLLKPHPLLLRIINDPRTPCWVVTFSVWQHLPRVETCDFVLLFQGRRFWLKPWIIHREIHESCHSHIHVILSELWSLDTSFIIYKKLKQTTRQSKLFPKVQFFSSLLTHKTGSEVGCSQSGTGTGKIQPRAIWAH